NMDQSWGLHFSREGRPMICADTNDGRPSDHRLQCWDILSGKRALEFPPLKAAGGTFGNTQYAAFSPDGTLAAEGVFHFDPERQEMTSVRVWQLPGLRQLSHIPRDLPFGKCAAFSPESRILALGGDDGVIRLVEVASGKVVRELRGHDAEVTGVTFARDGRRL